MIQGVDISQWQAGIDYDTFAQGVEFAIVRASYSNWLIDGMHWLHTSELRARGVALGHYHYAMPGESAAPEQARTFLDGVGWYFPGEILALDIEEDNPALVFWSEQFARVILNVTGRPPVLYTNVDFLQRYDFSSLHEMGCPLWLASWGTAPDDFVAPWPDGKARIHQHTSAGTIAGYQGDIDLDAFDGSRQDFEALGRLS